MSKLKRCSILLAVIIFALDNAFLKAIPAGTEPFEVIALSSVIATPLSPDRILDCSQFHRLQLFQYRFPGIHQCQYRFLSFFFDSRHRPHTANACWQA